MARKRSETALPREKVTTRISSEARYRLTVLQAELRRRGLRGVTEGKILDVLIMHADDDEVAKLLR